MSTDPFDEAPHDHSAPIIRPLASPLVARNRSSDAVDVFSPLPGDAQSPSSQRRPQRNVAEHDPHMDQTRASPAVAVMHRRGMSTDGLSSQDNSHAFLNAVPSGVRHNRSRSHEFEDHMLGSIYAPREVCPKCKAPRSSSVYCAVSKLHHGTDAPMPEEQPVAPDDPANKDALGAGAEESEPAAAMATPTPKKKGWSLFKTKEEKQLAALEEEEDIARKRLIKSKSNAEGEKYGREVIRGAFVDGLFILVTAEKKISGVVTLESGKRGTVEQKEDSERRNVLKLEAKERKAILKKNPSAILTVTPAAAAADDDGAAASPAHTDAGPSGEPESPAAPSTHDDASAVDALSPAAATDDGSFANNNSQAVTATGSPSAT
mmetsp:Transcript_34044/g.105130  ORF Transcript_34044/g.105130 Transcript_34044/m.105130 type:complete len:376 (-) Transcript_34044:103-1230(-)